MTNPHRTWLIAVLTGGPLPPEPLPADALFTAEDQGVLALVAQALDERQTGVTEAMLQTFRDAARTESLGQLAMLAEQQRVFLALATANLPYLVLKGGGLAHWLYAKPHLRLVTDLDLLLPGRATLTQLQPVLAALGYGMPPEAGTRIGKEHPFQKPGGPYGQYTVDAHWALLNSPILADRFEFDELSAEAQVLPACAGARGLSAVHALFNACGHRALNLPYTYVQGIQNARSLRWLWDIHLLAQTLTAADWHQLDAQARSKGLCGILADALGTAAAELDSSVPETLLTEWRRIARDERVRMRWFRSWPRYQWQQFLASDNQWRGRLQWLGQRLWPNPEAMRERYGDASEPGWRVLWRRLGIGLQRFFGG